MGEKYHFNLGGINHEVPVESYAGTLKLQTGPAKDKWVSNNFEFAAVKFSETEIIVSLGPNCPPNEQDISGLWEHTVYQLENLSAGLKVVATGNLPKSFNVKSKDLLLGPVVRLLPALHFELGCTQFFCWRRTPFKYERFVVDLRAIFESRVSQATFEIVDILEISDKLYTQAKNLAEKFVVWGPEVDDLDD